MQHFEDDIFLEFKALFEAFFALEIKSTFVGFVALCQESLILSIKMIFPFWLLLQTFT